jgi:NADH:ubiquinone oxidoreductase subunit D
MTDDELKELLRKAVERFNSLTPEEQRKHRREQAKGYALAEAYLGSDADEAAYRHAVATNNVPEIQRLADAAEHRRIQANALVDEVLL